MVTYVVWIFYMSEPKYINNANENKVQVYDYISVPGGRYDDQVLNGIVLQMDTSRMLVKLPHRYSVFRSEYRELPITSGFRIVGKGTFYHKVNNYVGFNIMFITQAIIMILIIVLSNTTYKLLFDVFDLD